MELALVTVSMGLFFLVSWVLNVATIALSLDWEWFGVSGDFKNVHPYKRTLIHLVSRFFSSFVIYVFLIYTYDSTFKNFQRIPDFIVCLIVTDVLYRSPGFESFFWRFFFWSNYLCVF